LIPQFIGALILYSRMIKEEDKKKIQEIIGKIKCAKNFKCAESGFENMCKARDFGDDHALHCLDDSPTPCPFAAVYNDGFEMRFCRCPLRIYLAKNLGK